MRSGSCEGAPGGAGRGSWRAGPEKRQGRQDREGRQGAVEGREGQGQECGWQ